MSSIGTYPELSAGQTAFSKQIWTRRGVHLLIGRMAVARTASFHIQNAELKNKWTTLNMKDNSREISICGDSMIIWLRCLLLLAWSYPLFIMSSSYCHSGPTRSNVRFLGLAIIGGPYWLWRSCLSSFCTLGNLPTKSGMIGTSRPATKAMPTTRPNTIILWWRGKTFSSDRWGSRWKAWGCSSHIGPGCFCSRIS